MQVASAGGRWRSRRGPERLPQRLSAGGWVAELPGGTDRRGPRLQSGAAGPTSVLRAVERGNLSTRVCVVVTSQLVWILRGSKSLDVGCWRRLRMAAAIRSDIMGSSGRPQCL